MQNNVFETLIGAIVVAVAAFFFFYAYTTTNTTSMSGYTVHARLARVDGLNVGTDVRLSGVKIGTISSMTLDPKTYLVDVTLNIRKGIPLPDDTSMAVTSAGIMGGSYVNLTPGGDDQMIPPGGWIKTAQGSVDVMGLIGRFMNQNAQSGGQGGGSGSKPAPNGAAPAPAPGPAPVPAMPGGH